MAISLEQFLDRIADSGLMSRAEVQALVDRVPATDRPTDGRQLARLLVRLKKLTAFQTQYVYSGQGKSLVLGNYVVLDKLGEGGMGMVLKARHRRMARIVALKILSPSVTRSPKALRRFQREVKASAKLEHANIVTAYDADEARGTHFLVMQYVQGTDLGALVKKKGALPVNQALSCVLQAARGLEYAHAHGVVHRDIKPSNLMLDAEGTVKILDMGLARLESAGEQQDQLTGTGQILGTVDFMAPEQAVDTQQADARADIYSLGITLWYLLTGRAVYAGSTIVMKLMAHQNSSIPSLQEACPAVSPALDVVFSKMIAKTPDARYQSMTEVIAELESCLGSSASPPSVASAPGEDSRWDAFLHEWKSGAETRLATPPAAKKKAVATSPADPHETMQSTHGDTDPELHPSFAGRQPRQLSRSGSAGPVEAIRRAIGWLVQPPRSRQVLVGVAGGGALILVLAAIVFFVQTGDGVIRVEINDPAIEVAIQGTEIVLKQADQGKDVKLSPGNHTLVVQRGDFKFETDQLILKRGQTVTVRVELLGGKIQVRQGEKLIGEKELSRNPVAERTTSSHNPPPLAVAPFDAATAKKHQKAWADYLGVPVEADVALTDGVKLTMVLIPPGEFMMGSPEDEMEHNDDEGQHRVRITRPFYLGMHEVTQGQWGQVMGTSPWKGQTWVKEGADYPASYVNWDDAVAFCKKVSAKEGQTYRLPTEAEWEYACRAGNQTAYSFGADASVFGSYVWYGGFSGDGNCKGELYAHRVGRKRPNGFGLYDMHGNVWEWCSDWYSMDYYANSPVDNPTGPAVGSGRVLRGGGWSSLAEGCRSAYRNKNTPDYGYSYLGFRVAVVPSE